jgi:hypothetical protein
MIEVREQRQRSGLEELGQRSGPKIEARDLNLRSPWAGSKLTPL